MKVVLKKEVIKPLFFIILFGPVIHSAFFLANHEIPNQAPALFAAAIEFLLPPLYLISAGAAGVALAGWLNVWELAAENKESE